ncbi:dihydrofolate reductase family protein [Actinophytocola oryzae]|uniref:Riboflavin biosynthesis protein RibD n=1 Tax=Actinophytocola oryzae TaxID=502181 RepID=A0A4R7VRB0_9PSEU|nr:dihydrofolate reductase family protein [Actinophytocola oryzae]TDV52323.1 diaminohydroxyphosphoribosylaminopyrimidine deaminase [Actinophytocola oryzae]
MYILLSCAVSLDGYLDDATDERLVLSNAADLDRVDAERAGVDAILVGANTIRRDDPRLSVRSPARRAAREAMGKAATPLKVILSTGDLPSGAAFRADGESLVTSGTVESVVGQLHARGVDRLMVEGGGRVLTEFLTSGLADELQLVVAPFFVGDSAAPRFVHDGRFPWHADHRATLATASAIGNVVLHRYLLSVGAVDRHWLARTIELSLRCPPSTTAFSVGAVVVDASGDEIAWGYSRETDDLVHAEESALAKLAPDDPRLPTATIYSSMEPCSGRKSRPRTCSTLIRDAAIPRVVFAYREPSTFVDGEGAEELTAAGVTVVEYPDLADQVRDANRLQLGG